MIADIDVLPVIQQAFPRGVVFPLSGIEFYLNVEGNALEWRMVIREDDTAAVLSEGKAYLTPERPDFSDKYVPSDVVIAFYRLVPAARENRLPPGGRIAMK